MITHRQVATNGITLHVAEAGPEDGPLVVLLHGFPELWRSWRHQLPVLADAGYRVLAPDVRGYGDSDAPPGPEGYDPFTLGRDVLGLLDDVGAESAVVVGHDWGAPIAWWLAARHPERVRAVAGLSVPHLPRAPSPPMPLLREHLGEDFYMVWFQEPGVAEAALSKEVRKTLCTRRQWTAAWAAEAREETRPPWFTEDELAAYVAAFERTGFTGGLNAYRSMDRTWELTAEGPTEVHQPALFLVGTRDPVLQFAPPEAMATTVPGVQTVRIEGAGHWVQQERPDEVNAALLAFLADL